MKKLLVIVVSLGLFFGMPGRADAWLNQWSDIPDHSGADADAIMTYHYQGYWSRYTSGYIKIHKYGASGCVYVQAKPVADFALDGSWKRKTPNRCATGVVTFPWSDTFYKSYSGFKFRICKDISWAADTCGNSVTIFHAR